MVSDDDQNGSVERDRDRMAPLQPEHRRLSSFSGKETTLSPGFDVRRILPHSKQRSVGSFVFLDHFGPVETSVRAMDVGPHPHIGLATLTYLYEGAILHRDSTGAQHHIVPGGVNYMISGKGVVHSERGKPDDINGHLQTDDDKLQQIPKRSHGLQLWLALPKDDEDVDPSFHSSNAVPIPLMTDNDDSSQNPSSSRRSNLQSSADLVIGEFNGTRSNIPLHPKMGKVFFLDVNLLQKGEIFNFCSRPVSMSQKVPSAAEEIVEIGFYVVSGKIRLQGKTFGEDSQELLPESFQVFKVDMISLDGQLVATSPGQTRVAIIGGTPLPEKRFMAWNFVSSSKQKIEDAIKAWGDADKSIDRTIFPPVVGEPNDDSIPFPTKTKSL